MFRSRSIPTLFAALLALSACSDPTTPVSGPDFAGVPFDPQPATIAWQARARMLVSGANFSALAAGRTYAALGVAQYRAVKAVNEATDLGGLAQFEAQRAAVAGASARVLLFLFPNATDSIQKQLARESDVGPGGVHPAYTRGLEIGRTAGDAAVTRLQTDRFSAPWTDTAPRGPGIWSGTGTPAGVMLGRAVPYFMTSGSQFRPAPPPAFLSPEFNASLAEVATITQNRTPAQHAIALAWNFGGGTPTPPGYWNQVATELTTANDMNEEATAEVFALMNASIFDALIGCWDAKYTYWFIRPYQATSISTSLAAPNHPAYPSGHSCVSSAAATVLSHFFPSNAADLANRVNEAGMSRIIAGIHYRFDITAGNEIGKAVAGLAVSRGL